MDRRRGKNYKNSWSHLHTPGNISYLNLVKKIIDLSCNFKYKDSFQGILFVSQEKLTEKMEFLAVVFYDMEDDPEVENLQVKSELVFLILNT